MFAELRGDMLCSRGDLDISGITKSSLFDFQQLVVWWSAASTHCFDLTEPLSHLLTSSPQDLEKIHNCLAVRFSLRRWHNLINFHTYLQKIIETMLKLKPMTVALCAFKESSGNNWHISTTSRWSSRKATEVTYRWRQPDMWQPSNQPADSWIYM